MHSWVELHRAALDITPGHLLSKRVSGPEPTLFPKMPETVTVDLVCCKGTLAVIMIAILFWNPANLLDSYAAADEMAPLIDPDCTPVQPLVVMHVSIVCWPP